MRKIQAFVLAALLAAASLSLAGCAQWFENPAKPANAAISAANAHLKQAAALESRIQTAATSLESIPYSKHGAAAALKTTAQLKTMLANEKTELQAAKTAMDGIAKMDVAEGFKQYATLESAAIATRITLADTNARLYDAMDRLYAALKSGTLKIDPQQVIAVVNQIKKESGTLTDQARQQSQSAVDYFTKNKLGG
jgi:hypothetical protein